MTTFLLCTVYVVSFSVLDFVCFNLGLLGCFWPILRSMPAISLFRFIFKLNSSKSIEFTHKCSGIQS